MLVSREDKYAFERVHLNPKCRLHALGLQLIILGAFDDIPVLLNQVEINGI